MLRESSMSDRSVVSVAINIRIGDEEVGLGQGGEEGGVNEWMKW